MLKSILENNILSNNITSFKSQVNKSSTALLIKILPFLCACGNLLMLEILDSKLNIETLPNRGTGQQITSVIAIQHSPAKGTPPLNTEFLSQKM